MAEEIIDKEKAKEIANATEKTEEKTDIKKAGKKQEQKEKTEKTKKEKEDIGKAKKTEAVVRGVDLPISTLHAGAICKFIKNKKIEEAINLLESVVKKKTAVPFKGEIPHRKGMMSGRYPIKASQHFIRLLRSLSANASVNGLDLEKVKIFAIANQASRPYKRFGSERFKRSHVLIKLK